MTDNIERFYDLYHGQTCLIAVPGPNLALTPPESFDLPSFAINTVYKYPGWEPDYYIWVDRGNAENVPFFEEVKVAYPHAVKFVPTPDFDDAQGENVYHFRHRPGIELFVAGQLANQREAMTKYGITYRRIHDATLQIAWWMGFKTVLMIGLQHKPGTRKEHFWGQADYEPSTSNFVWEERGLRECSQTMSDMKIINISADTYLPESVLPRDDWRKWSKQQ